MIVITDYRDLRKAITTKKVMNIFPSSFTQSGHIVVGLLALLDLTWHGWQMVCELLKITDWSHLMIFTS